MRGLVLAIAITAAINAAPIALSGQAQSPRAPVDAAAKVIDAAGKAMGTQLLGNIQFTANGSSYAMGESFKPGMPWPAFKVTRYRVDIDYLLPGIRIDHERTNPDGPMRGGGGLPLTAPQRQIQSLSKTVAWNMADLNGARAALAPGAVNERLLEIWSSPHGVIKAAQMAGARAKVTVERRADGTDAPVITFAAAGTTVTATLNADNYVERVVTRADNAVLGDVTTETTFSDYRDAKQIGPEPAHPEDLAGVMFPTRIVRKQAGFPVLDLTITDVHPNAYMVFPIPASVAAEAAHPPVPVKVDVQKVAEGVYYLTGNTHNTVAVEFNGYVVLIEAPSDEAQTAAVIDAMKKAIPAKPIRYVVNTHHHFDHAGGLRAIAAEGIPVITHSANKAYYEKVSTNPHTIAPDRLARARRRPRIEVVLDKRILTDGHQTLELHELRGSDHAEGMLVGYLPRARILVEADVFNPPDSGAPAGAVSREAANLYDNVQRLKLDVRQILPIHGRLVTIDDLRAASGKAGE